MWRFVAGLVLPDVSNVRSASAFNRAPKPWKTKVQVPSKLRGKIVEDNRNNMEDLNYQTIILQYIITSISSWVYWRVFLFCMRGDLISNLCPKADYVY